MEYRNDLELIKITGELFNKIHFIKLICGHDHNDDICNVKNTKLLCNHFNKFLFHMSYIKKQIHVINLLYDIIEESSQNQMNKLVECLSKIKYPYTKFNTYATTTDKNDIKSINYITQIIQQNNVNMEPCFKFFLPDIENGVSGSCEDVDYVSDYISFLKKIFESYFLDLLGCYVYSIIELYPKNISDNSNHHTRSIIIEQSITFDHYEMANNIINGNTYEYFSRLIDNSTELHEHVYKTKEYIYETFIKDKVESRCKNFLIRRLQTPYYNYLKLTLTKNTDINTSNLKMPIILNTNLASIYIEI
jgi:hypothetical protein